MNWLKFYICICFLLCAEVAYSQKNITVRGGVKDAFTYELLDSVKVDFMKRDSSLVYSLTTQGTWGSYGFVHNIDARGGIMLLRGESYIVRLSKKGYETAYYNYKVKAGNRETWLRLPDYKLKRMPQSTSDVKTLGEAVVKASKVRMVVKGDTIEWNADAFQLQNGSMLDGLLKMLPGFSINGGQISVNGQIVSSLLVNGENFFRGDPRVALENLPGFMVDKVKVYHKEHAYSYITKERDINELPLVVDVRLKKQYSIGWTANAEAGYGLQDRYMGRLFGLRFTPNSRIALFGNGNNTNDTREPGTSGDWTTQSDASGRTDMAKGGLELLVKDKKGLWKYTGNAKASYLKRIDSDASSGETFLATGGSTFSRSTNWNRTKEFSLNTTHSLELRKARNFFNIALSGAYNHGKQKGISKSAEFRDKPEEAYRSASLDTLFANLTTGNIVPSASTYLNALLINESLGQSLADKNAWQVGFNIEGYTSIPHTPDFLQTNGQLTISREAIEPYSNNQYYLANQQQTERRYWYNPQQDFRINAQWSINYMAQLNKVWINPFYNISINYHDSNQPHYRLDNLEEDIPTFGMLPSTAEALRNTIDANNSVWSRKNTVLHGGGSEFIFWWKDYQQHFHFKPVVVWQSDKLSYNRGALDLHPRRNQIFFEPEISYRMDDFSIEYKLSHSMPDLISMQPYTDDANPLHVLQGNPNLKTTIHHKVNLQRSFMKRDIAMNGQLAAYWEVSQHALAYGMDLDEYTGIRHYQPRNVSGNWQTGASFVYGRRFDKKQRFLFNNALRVNYANCVDYVSARSSVRDFNVGEQFKVNANLGKVLLNATIDGRYLHAASKRSGFQEINSFDLTYSLGASVQLPLDFTLLLDMNLLEREGYSDQTMNDVRFVCNAQLNKIFMHGKIRLTLQGYDLFHGLSNVTKVINAQGNTETWRRSLPSYAMLRFAYRFDMKKK